MDKNSVSAPQLPRRPSRFTVGLLSGTAGLAALALQGCAGGGSPRAQEPSEPAPALVSSPPPGPAVSCTSAEFGPSVVPDADYDSRWGAAASAFSAVPTTKQRPLEECGFNALLPKLTSLTCNDGSNPFAGDLRAAHDSRRGSVGPGGRCGAIIEVYVVGCPEGEYEVFADLYFCSEDAAKAF